MTTAWPAAPTGWAWNDLDPLVGLVQPVVEDEGRPGGVHQIRWEPEQSTRVTFDRRDGEVVVCEARDGSLQLTALSQDPALTGVAAMLDPVRLASRLERLLRTRVDDCTVTPVSRAARRRIRWPFSAPPPQTSRRCTSGAWRSKASVAVRTVSSASVAWTSVASDPAP